MYNLICTSGYYSVHNERQMKKKCIKKSYIIATNKSKFSLQQIADNLNKKIPKVRLTTSSISDSLLAVNSNAILNIGTLNVKSEIEKDICVPSNNNYDTEKYNTHQSFNLMFCDNKNNIENMKGSAYLIEDVLSIDDKPNILIDSSNNMMSDLLPTANSNTALNIGISNVNNDIKNISTILNKPSEETENVECDEFDSTFIKYENANVVDKFKSPKKSLKILGAVWDDRNMYVETSDNPKSKLNMCPYCKKLQTQLTRHLESIHKIEEDVKKFRLLPKGSSERKKIINILRRTGNFMYNTDSNINKGDLIVCRRPRKNRQAADFIPCAKCKGFFTKNNIRHHFRSCVQKQAHPERNVKILGRTVACRIHHSACTLLRRLVFPVMREDNITEMIRYDELLIAYGNKLCQNKNRPQHQHDMIRTQLRLLGRFLIVLRDIDNSVVDFTSVYDPTKYEQCMKAVNELAQFDKTTGTYKILSVASSLGRHMKQVGQVLKSICIKKQEFHKQTMVEDFLKLFTENYLASVNKIILETQGCKKRQKNIVLPSIDDIEMFNAYLKSERTKALQFLQTTGFSNQAWLMLAETTLVSIMVLNRRRPSELERVLIENLKNCAAISKEEAPELYKSLSKYVRMTISDKKGRLVPVLLHEEILKCMQMIVNYRKDAGVPENNPYIFGIYTIDKNRYKYLRASVLMRKHSIISGLKIPTSLRNTMLWKHIATVCISLAISEHEVNDLMDFERHHEKTYKSHYKQSIITNLAISRLLKYTQGEDTSDESDNVDEDENENDLTNDINIDSILNISDTLSALTKTRQSEQLPINEKDFNNHINDNEKKNKVNRPSKRKINDNSENMAESDDECNTELNISNTLSLKETKQSEEVFRKKNNVNNNTKRNKKKTSPFDTITRKKRDGWMRNAQ